MGPSAEDIESPSTPRNKLYARMLTLLETGSGAYEKEAMKHIGAHIRGMGISLCRYLKRTIHLLGAKLGRPSVSVTCLCVSENARVHDFVQSPEMYKHSLPGRHSGCDSTSDFGCLSRRYPFCLSAIAWSRAICSQSRRRARFRCHQPALRQLKLHPRCKLDFERL